MMKTKPSSGITFETLFESANDLLNAGKHAAAKDAYEQAYAMAPNWQSAYGLGLACANLGLRPDAIRYYQEATLHDPTVIEPRVNLANLLRDGGQYDEARFHHIVAYSINPRHALTAYNAALAMERDGQLRIARELLRRCLHLDSNCDLAWRSLAALPAETPQPADLPPPPSDAKVYNDVLKRDPSRQEESIADLEGILARGVTHAPIIVDLGNLYLAAGRTADAVAMQRRAIERNELLASAHHNLGAALEALGDYEEAGRCYQRALALSPELVQSWLNYGRILANKMGRLDWACDCFLRAEALEPNDPTPTIEFTNVAQKLRRTNDVIAAMERLRKKHPDNFMVSNNLGAILLDLNRLDEALACFEEALGVNPDSAMAQSNVGAVYELKGVYDKALAAYRRAHELMPDSSSILARILHVSQHQCEWEGIDRLFDEAIRLVRAGKFEGVNPFSLITVPGIDRFDQLRCAEAFTDERLGYLKPMALPPVKPSERHGSRIRVGYLSSDLYDHATSWLIAETIELHDRKKFEIVAYSYGPGYETPTRQRLKASFDRFEDVRDMTDEQAAHKIRTDEIDILIDLKGYTQGCRTGIVALRPAPVQLNYLGFPGTLGADFVDYIVSDSIVSPSQYADGYSEKILRLPHCYQPNDRKRPLPPAPTRKEAGLPEEGFVFCSFNNVYKIIPAMFDVWCRLLRESPGSVLWILSSNTGAFANLQKEAEKRGVDGARLILAPRVGLAEHIARFRCADLFVDTFPCAAHTTASDSLWAAVAVVTMVCDTFASRVAASLLEAAGLPELVADNFDDYFRIARDIATHPEKARALKAKLEAERMTSPVFDSVAYTRDLEAAFIEAFEAWRKGGRTP